MRHEVVTTVAVAAALFGGCGSDSTSGNQPDGSTDTIVPGSKYIPAAFENVIDSMIAAINAKNLSASAKPPIAILLKDLTAYYAPVVVGANRMSTRLACPSVVEAPLQDHPMTDAEKIVAQNEYLQRYLDSAATTKYRGMGISPFGADDASVGYLDSFVQNLGPVVTIDSDSPTSKRSYFIATDNYQAGVAAAKTIRQVLNTGDTIAVFGTTDVNWLSGLVRAQGAEEGASAQGLVVAPRIPVKWDEAADVAAITAALQDTSLNIKGLLCMYSNSDKCAMAVEATGKKDSVKIVGFDMTTESKTYFDQGYFHALMVQRQYYMGQFGVLVPYAINVLGAQQTAQLLQPLLVNSFAIDTGLDVVTTDSYADYNAYLSSVGINNQ